MTESLKFNIIYAILGFIIIEIILIWIFIRESRLITAEKDALIDGLTNIFNRRHFNNLLKIELSRHRRSYQPLSLIICDIDYFKNFNDTYGHQAGDDCLKKIANKLKHSAQRSSDCVARYGGEEFVILLPNTKVEGALYVANRTRQAIEKLNIQHENSQTAPFVTISLGVACTETLGDQDNLLGAADRYLYLAKKDGRNMVVFQDNK